MPTNIYTYRWQQERKRFLAMRPLCRRCEHKGKVEIATVVDHIIPHGGDPKLFWDRSNWQPLCKRCHDGAKQQQEKIGYVKDIGLDGFPTDPGHPFNKTSLRGG